MAALVTCVLCALIIVKPQEFIPSLSDLPIVYLFFGITLLAVVIGVALGSVRAAMAPQIPLFLAFVGWALLVTLIKRPDAVEERLGAFVVLGGIFFAVALGASSQGGLKLFAAMFLGCALFVSAVAVSQYFGPHECFLGPPDERSATGNFVSDGRPCETALDCREEAPVPNGNYICEQAGLFGTFTVGDRVRYRGALADPNELSLMVSAAIPFGLAFAEVRRRRRAAVVRVEADRAPARPAVDEGLVERSARLRTIPATLLLAATGFLVVIAKSRTGLIAYLAVTGIYFIQRVGPWGMVAGFVVGPPMLLFGGRSGAEADDSANERTELLLEGFELLRKTSGLGVGAGQFPTESSLGLTAHNAYVLAAAETGLVGVLLFGLLLYVAVKVPVSLWFGDYRISPTIAAMAPALAISLCGVMVGIVFLSWTYEEVLYMLLGASVALYAVARSEDPRFRVRLSGTEMVVVSAGILASLAAMYVGARLRG